MDSVSGFARVPLARFLDIAVLSNYSGAEMVASIKMLQIIARLR